MKDGLKFSYRGSRITLYAAIMLLVFNMSSCKKEYSFKPEKTNFEACGDGDTINIKIETDAPEENWVAECDAKWIKIGKKTDNIEVVLDENDNNADGKDERTAEIILRCKESNDSVTKITVVQPTGRFIDLGLSVKWAKCNVGAEKPEDIGDYYAWGEISTKYSYTYGNSLTRGKVMKDISGNAKNDAATAKLGSIARTPTGKEIGELGRCCSWAIKTRNGVNGRLVKGRNGCTIFLPAGGLFEGNTIKYKGKNGYYLSSEPLNNGLDGGFYEDACEPQCIYSEGLAFFENDSSFKSLLCNRPDGCNIRPVKNK